MQFVKVRNEWRASVDWLTIRKLFLFSLIFYTAASCRLDDRNDSICRPNISRLIRIIYQSRIFCWKVRCEYTPIVMDFINIRFDNSIEIAVFYKQNRVNWLVINVVLLCTHKRGCKPLVLYLKLHIEPVKTHKTFFRGAIPNRSHRRRTACKRESFVRLHL